MKKMKRTKIGGMMGIVVIGLILIPTTDAAILWGPYITDTDINSTTINWKTEDTTPEMVKYATEEYYTEHGDYDHTIEDTEEAQLHHLVIKNLTPSTVYHYQLTVEGDPTGDYTLRTYGDGSFTFVVYGDTREQTGLFTQMERHKLVADRIAEEENVSFVIHTGDFACFGDDLDEWNDFFDAGGAMLANTTIYPVLGNHEDNHTNYYEAFGVSEWYSFNCGNAHFAVLDSNDWADITSETAWLQEDLDRNTTWKFVSFHHPPYSSDERHWGGWTHLRDHWGNIFIENNVDAVFNGHVHVYERYLENGIQYVVLGCGGAPLYSLAEEKIPGYQNSMEHTLGYARITVNGEEATMDLIKVADVSEGNKKVTYVYPPNTIFETVILGEVFDRKVLSATANVEIPMIGITLNRSEIDYGSVAAGEGSENETVKITNIGSSEVSVTLDIDATTETGQDFYEASLFVNDDLYNPISTITSIPSGSDDDVTTQLRVPSDWNEGGTYDATFVFWAEV